MYFGSNLQYLRRRSGMTQEKLANRLCVSRQAISKWESGETVPEISTLLQLSELFSCSLDTLVRQELSCEDSVRIVNVKGFSMVRYCTISPNAQEDVRLILRNWAAAQSLTEPVLLLWGFPYVTQEQKHRFSLQGFEAACVLPDGFSASDSKLPVTAQSDCAYAVITMREPEGRSSPQIAQAIRTILEFLQEKGLRKTAEEGFLPFFERCTVQNGVPVRELYLQCRNAPSTEDMQL